MAIQLPRQQPPYNPMAPAVPTAPPVLFEPPGALTDKRHEVWLAAAGGEGWGGCEVWASINGDSYRRMGMLFPGAVVGALTSPLPSSPDPDTINSTTVNVAPSLGEIHPGADRDADMFTTLCWINDELIAHTTAPLVGPYEYQLGRRLRRGVFGTTIKDHAAGAQFARLNGAIWRHQYPAHLAGHTIYVKLPAFNPHYQQLQGLDEVPYYTLTVTGASVK
jgi:hypothetical protein